MKFFRSIIGTNHYVECFVATFDINALISDYNEPNDISKKWQVFFYNSIKKKNLK